MKMMKLMMMMMTMMIVSIDWMYNGKCRLHCFAFHWLLKCIRLTFDTHLDMLGNFRLPVHVLLNTHAHTHIFIYKR